MIDLDIVQILQELSQIRPVFHSEADFQHALAWEIHRALPDSQLRLEFVPPWLESRPHLEIWVQRGLDALAIELKYKTRKIIAMNGDELLFLQDHSAQDLGRYDFLKDIQRLEDVVSSKGNVAGWPYS